uniref:Uncharacterized protein n=1 Tax=Arundo donax TaxID=35708 RepID=A0A0A9BMP5_ARUDO
MHAAFDQLCLRPLCPLAGGSPQVLSRPVLTGLFLLKVCIFLAHAYSISG